MPGLGADTGEAVAVAGGDDGEVGSPVNAIHLRYLLTDLFFFVLVDAVSIHPQITVSERSSATVMASIIRLGIKSGRRDMTGLEEDVTVRVLIGILGTANR